METKKSRQRQVSTSGIEVSSSNQSTNYSIMKESMLKTCGVYRNHDLGTMIHQVSLVMVSNGTSTVLGVPVFVVIGKLNQWLGIAVLAHLGCLVLTSWPTGVDHVF